MPDKRIEGQRTIVSGASSGIGAAIAKRFAVEGASVWAAGGSNAEGLERTLEACTGAGVKAGGKGYDLSDSNNAATLIQEGAAFLGGLDIFVSCAGARNHKPLTEFSGEEVDFLFEVNAKSPFRASIEAAKIMMAQKSGRILIIGSIHAMIGVEDNSLYCTTKASNHNMTRGHRAGAPRHPRELPGSRNHRDRPGPEDSRQPARLRGIEAGEHLREALRHPGGDGRGRPVHGLRGKRLHERRHRHERRRDDRRLED